MDALALESPTVAGGLPEQSADGGFVFYRFAPVTEKRQQKLIENRLRRPVPDAHTPLVINPPSFR